MDKLLIRGGRTLQGEVTISGAKNAALPELCAALLTPEPVTLANVPLLKDVSTTLKVLAQLGASSVRDPADASVVTVDASSITSTAMSIASSTLPAASAGRDFSAKRLAIVSIRRADRACMIAALLPN